MNVIIHDVMEPKVERKRFINSSVSMYKSTKTTDELSLASSLAWPAPAPLGRLSRFWSPATFIRIDGLLSKIRDWLPGGLVIALPVDQVLDPTIVLLALVDEASDGPFIIASRPI